MTAPSLHDEGWRQGSLIRESLDVHFLGLKNDGTIEDRTLHHGLWLLVTQDCDLDQTRITNLTRQLELRPVYAQTTDDKVDGWRTRNVLVKEGLVLRADSPKLTLSVAALQALKPKREDDVEEDRRVQIKTWLGLRYDRPAIPKPFVPSAELLYARIIAELPDRFRNVVRDSWVYFEEDASIRLFLILGDDHQDRVQEVLDWLDDDVIPALIDQGVIVRERQAATSRGTSLWILQTYYGLDKTDLSLNA
jgi:hypothetical protein